MADSKTIREEIEALCPCADDSSQMYPGCRRGQAMTCTCFKILRKGAGDCLWPGHALALRLAERVERLEAQHAGCEDLLKLLDEARRERDALQALKRSVDEALNSGDGVYRP